MANNNNTMLSIRDWFKTAIPHPDNAALQVQLGVHFEEVCEMLECLSGSTLNTDMDLLAATTALRQISNNLKQGRASVEIKSKIDLLDALCDQVVTANGVAWMANLDLMPALIEVNHSNYSKFVNGRPVFNEHGKISKGPNYFRPNLSPFIALRDE